MRTLLDLSDVLKKDELFRALDAARRKHGDFLDELARELGANANGRRHGPALLEEFLKQVKDHRPTESGLEADVFKVFLETRLPPWEPQVDAFDRTGKFICRIDFAWPRERVALMCDGHLWHLGREFWEKDNHQRRRLAANGWTVFPVTRRMLATAEWLTDLQQLLAAQRRLLGLTGT